MKHFAQINKLLGGCGSKNLGCKIVALFTGPWQGAAIKMLIPCNSPFLFDNKFTSIVELCDRYDIFQHNS
jgi:hypothetical protein